MDGSCEQTAGRILSRYALPQRLILGAGLFLIECFCAIRRKNIEIHFIPAHLGL